MVKTDDSWRQQAIDATRSTPTPFCLKKKSVKLGKKNTDSSPCDPTDRIHQEEETKVQTQLNLEKPGKTKWNPVKLGKTQ